MSEGITCYERDEALCEDPMCARVGCRLRNERLARSSTATKELPCPFCGSADLTLTIDRHGWKVVQCDECGTTGPCIDLEGDEYIDHWNTRVPAQASPDRDAIARVINPVAFVVDEPRMKDSDTKASMRESALRKADAIIALTPAQPTQGGDKGEAARRTAQGFADFWSDQSGKNESRREHYEVIASQFQRIANAIAVPQPASSARKWDEGEHEGCGIDSQRAMERQSTGDKGDVEGARLSNWLADYSHDLMEDGDLDQEAAEVKRAARWIADRLRDSAYASRGASDIAAERQRQVSAEGWTPARDDEHGDSQLALAALCYLYASTYDPVYFMPRYWPWDRSWWKPADARRNLVKAGALIAAEIDRLDRASSVPSTSLGSAAE